MARILTGVVLALVSLLLLVGFLRSGASLTSASTIVALLIGVALPGAAAVALLAGRLTQGRRLVSRRDELRRRTIDAELLRLAGQHDGRLTVVEVVRDLAISPAEAEAALNALHTREMVEIEITESGVLVYSFTDVRGLHEKHDARGLLDA